MQGYRGLVVKFGIIFANTMKFASREGLNELATGAESAGFESLWTVEHVLFPDAYESEYPYDVGGKMAMTAETPLPDPLIWLTWVAAVTERLRLGTGILILPQRNPLVLAKSLATLDELSGGRMELGVGVGWLREEFDALGIPFERRGARTDEYIDIMRNVWGNDHAEHRGEFSDFSGVSVNPKPVNGSVPIHIGGHTTRSAKRAGQLGDGYFPGKGNLSELIDIVRQTASDAGRDPSMIEITSHSAGIFGDDPTGAVEELAALGVGRIVVPSYVFLKNTSAALQDFADRVIASSN